MPPRPPQRVNQYSSRSQSLENAAAETSILRSRARRKNLPKVETASGEGFGDAAAVAADAVTDVAMGVIERRSRVWQGPRLRVLLRLLLLLLVRRNRAELASRDRQPDINRCCCRENPFPSISA